MSRSEDGTEIRKYYDLGPEEDPAGIPRSDFEQDGFRYTLIDLLKQELPENESRQHTETVSLESKSKDMESVLALLPQEKEFITEDGLSGVLTLQLDTVQVEVAGYGSSTREVSATRSYSIDEVFMDITNYLDTYKMTARELTRTIILDILKTTGITAAAGMGTNLYLAKVAMDIVAKHVHPDQDGVRIAKLNEMTYRRLLWTHRPLTDFWRVGKGYANKLEAHGLYTMGDIARCSIGKPGDYHSEELLYRLFGVNAEILIDHAWGWEPCTIADVKAYKPENKSIVSGQVLQCPYDFKKARLVVREMADALALDLVDKGLVTNQLVLTVGYDRENLDDPSRRQSYRGPVTTDRYGRKIPKHAVGTENFPYTSSASDLLKAVSALYDRIVDENLLIRRLSISANKLLPEVDVPKDEAEQLDLFTDYAAKEQQEQADEAAHARERKIQEAMLGIKKKFGKNAILKGMNLEEGATARERNQTIGGHHE